MRIFVRNVILAAAFVLASPAGAAAGSTLESTVTAANNSFVPDLVRGDAVQAASPFAPDAIFIFGDNKVVRGKAAIVDMLRQRLQTTKFLGGGCRTHTLESVGSTAWETGACSYSMIRDGRKLTAGGRFMTVWKRNSAARWSIEVNVAE